MSYDANMILHLKTSFKMVLNFVSTMPEINPRSLVNWPNCAIDQFSLHPRS